MEAIEFLKSRGVRNIVMDTHIDEKIIVSIIKYDFDKIPIVQAKGFIQILEREYKIDLSEWINEYNKYTIDNNIIPPESSFVLAKDEQKSSKKWVVILIAVIVAAGAWFAISSSADKINDSNQSIQTPKDEIIKNANETYKHSKESLNDNEIAQDSTDLTKSSSLKSDDEKMVEEEEDNVSNENVATLDEKDETIEEDNESDEVNSVEGQVISEDTNSSNLVSKSESESSVSSESSTSSSSSSSKSVKNSIDSDFIDKVVILPKVKIWVGVKNLDTGKKRNYMGKKPLTFTGTKRLLILTGHGNFTLQIDDEKIKFFSRYPMRFLIEDMHIKTITKDEYKKLLNANKN
jgi:hypothetical protein